APDGAGEPAWRMEAALRSDVGRRTQTGQEVVEVRREPEPVVYAGVQPPDLRVVSLPVVERDPPVPVAGEEKLARREAPLPRHVLGVPEVVQPDRQRDARTDPRPLADGSVVLRPTRSAGT